MQQREWILSVDVGTSSVKAAIFNGQADLIKEFSVSYPLVQPRPGWAEQDPQGLWDAFRQAVRNVLADVERAPNIMVLSTAMHAVMAVDQADKPLTRLITWADQRAESVAASLHLTSLGQELYQATGTPTHAMSPLVKLAWFRDNDPELFAGAKVWADLKSLILWQLLGEWVIDASLASATGLYNLNSGDWDPTALKWCGVTAEQLPRLVKTTDIFPIKPEVCAALGLPNNTRVVAGASDGALANLGVGAVTPGTLAVSIGTSGAVRSIVNKPQLDSAGRLFCYVVDDNHFVVGGPINNGGIVLRWLQGLLMGGSQELATEGALVQSFYAELNQEAAKISPGSDGLFCLPYLTGERAPIWRGDVSGSLWGLKLSHNRAHLMRAVLEGISYQLNAVVELLTNLIGPAKVVNATGGFTESPVWIEILTNVLDIHLQVPEHSHGSALGGAFLAWYALGQIAGLEEAAELVPVDRVQRPEEKSVQRYRQGYVIFKELVSLGDRQFSKLSEFAQGGSLDD